MIVLPRPLALSAAAAAALLCLSACPPTAQKEAAPAVPVGRKVLPITNGLPDDTPSHAAVVAMSQSSSFACSGTLISPRVVLTAGHCVEGASAGSMKIGFGNDISSPAMVWVGVSETRPNPGYSGSSLANDIGLVRLAGPPPAGVSPIPWLPPSLALTPADVGTTVVFSGFGETETGDYGTKLRVSDTLDLVCETSGAGCSWAGDVTPNHTLCYDQQPGGPCSGDSGGPAFVTVGGTEYVVGVTSYGDRSCVSDGCSTDATAFDQWIKDFIGDVGPTADGQPCSANNQCQSGFCTDGVCCNLSCSGTCVACSVAAGAKTDGVCGPVEGACDDGNKCTSGDKCQSGRCTGTLVTCPPPDQCHFYSSCNPADGQCGAYPVRPDGTDCDDGDECTVSDQCHAGACGGTARDTCPAPGPCLNDAVCADKKCGTYAPKADGDACDDGSPCTLGDTCQAGVCQAAEEVTCPPAGCRGWGACSPNTGKCIPGAPMADGLACDDGRACTEKDHCVSGECVGSTITGACTPDGCHGAGTCQPDGSCDAELLADGTACEEGDKCTAGDQCQAGVCVAGAALDCTPPDACHVGNKCNPKTGECAWTAAPAGSDCDDGSLCTTGDKCDGMSCKGTAVTCPVPAVECSTSGSCNPKTGQCDYNWVEDGTKCTGGKCASGVCKTEGCGCSTGSEPAVLAMALTALGLFVRRRP